jgi:hypothetical protein
VSNNRLLIGAACVAFGIFGAIRNWNSYIQESAIERDGSRAQAQVTRKWTRSDDDVGDDYFLGYWFDLPDGRNVEGQHEVSVVLYRSLRRGDSIPVLYSRADPRRNFPEGHGLTSPNHALVGSSFGALIALFGVGIVLWEWRGKRPA